ncbi:MAG TPA: MOSC N-terminal beta barrel domain-containing protein [Burkholderiaceae bacterium]|nr:MOSC N-terminal beta barrel domain-containing protein [Burkholderiaceae bacterium]
MTVTILSLHSYPVKSCAGIDHRSVALTSAGLHKDRHWVLVDRHGVFMTQRQHARMALIQPSLDDRGLTLRAPGMSPFPVANDSREPEPARVALHIFRSRTLGADEGDEVSGWLSEFLQLPCRLLRVHPQADRVASLTHVEAWRDKAHTWAPDFPARHRFGFADGFPLLVANQASLDELNGQLASQGMPAVGMNRFRPNIVLQGLPAYDEDYLAGWHTQGLRFAFVKPCARCPIPNIDPATAVSGTEPGLTLARHRQRPEGVLFGVNAVVAGAENGAVLTAGQEVTVEYDL